METGVQLDIHELHPPFVVTTHNNQTVGLAIGKWGELIRVIRLHRFYTWWLVSWSMLTRGTDFLVCTHFAGDMARRCALLLR